MNILMTLDENYVPQGRLMLETLRRWNPEEISVYVMHTSLTEKGLEELAASGCRVISVAMTGEEFRGAPITDRYPPEMYYRLLAARYLPEDLERILYLDPDMIVLGSLRELYDLPMTERIFYAAATHLKEFWRKINEKRLDLPQDGIYEMCIRDSRPAAQEAGGRLRLEPHPVYHGRGALPRRGGGLYLSV